MGKIHCKGERGAIPSAQDFLLNTLVNPEDGNDTAILQKIILTHQMCMGGQFTDRHTATTNQGGVALKPASKLTFAQKPSVNFYIRWQNGINLPKKHKADFNDFLTLQKLACKPTLQPSDLKTLILFFTTRIA